MKMTDLNFIGYDEWSRPVFRDPKGRLWKDVNCDNGTPALHSASGNEFDGEPDMPIRIYYPDFEI